LGHITGTSAETLAITHLTFNRHRAFTPALDKRADRADNEHMRQVPISLKLVAVLSLLAEATAAALVFWHSGPRAR
jgi:hypothetical protein